MTDPIISTARAAWELQVRTALTADDDTVVVNVSGWLDRGQEFPRVQLVEDPNDSVRTVFDFGGQFAPLRYIVVVEESGRERVEAGKRLDRYVSWDHDLSVFTAMAADPTLGGVIRDMNIAEAWTVNAEELRAELPVTFYAYKTLPEEP